MPSFHYITHATASPEGPLAATIFRRAISRAPRQGLMPGAMYIFALIVAAEYH